MNNILLFDSPAVRAPSPSSMSGGAPATAMTFSAEDAILDPSAAFGTRVITRHRGGAGPAAVLQTDAPSGWWVQGIRKIGDRLFVERVAL
jgi:hypothetical protein